MFRIGETVGQEEEGLTQEAKLCVMLRRFGLGVALLCILIIGMKAFAQPSLSQTAPAPPGHAAELGGFQDRIDAAVLALRESNSRFRDLPKQDVQELAEFVSGNMLFVLLHELGHASITQLGLPVLGRIEDASDSFATLMLLRVGSDFSHRVLTASAKGWFLADRRDRETGLKLVFYGEHGLDLQRAYQIVCMMVGSDEDKFNDLAEQTKLPEARQHTCLGDYSNAAFSWDLLLKPHRRASDQPMTRIDVAYGQAEGRTEVVEQVARAIRLLKTVAERASDELAWPAPLTLEMQSCGFPNAIWDFRMRTVTLCYELAAEFADLYRDFGNR
jgi:hypothetical protein